MAAPAAPLRAVTPSLPEGERRQLTVMFSDLVGSTSLSELLDPEEWREVVRAYQQAAAAVVARFEGHVAQYLGDGILVYFGYPHAHEDAAQRAVLAALGILEEMGHLNARLRAGQRVELSVRLGIHTGLVVVGEVGGGERREQLALGDTPNVAARLQGVGEPGTVLISETTHRLVQPFFTFRPLGPQTLKGLAREMEVYQVLAESGAPADLDEAPAAKLTPLVGRDQELGLLLERWELAKEGDGQVVFLSADAGVGKTRLVRALKECVADEMSARVEFRCSPYYQNSAFQPVIAHLQRVLRLGGQDSPEQKVEKLEAALLPYDFSLAEAVPLLAPLLSLPLTDPYTPLDLSPPMQKRKTLEVLVAWLLKLAAERPLLFVVEDQQWVDPSTLEFLNLTVEQMPSASILSLFTLRQGFQPPWAMRSNFAQITLNRLPRKHVETLIGKLAGEKRLPEEVMQQLVRQTDGVPLFVEELTRMVLESALLRECEDHYELTGPLPPLAIPATLQDSLMARLDRLATVKEVAQVAATLGREFSYELLREVSPIEEAALQTALSRLVEAELLFQKGFPPQSHFVFKHLLIQEAAYQSLLKSKRQHYHREIARVLAERFPETAESQPELVAHHYSEAGLAQPAAEYWQRAGRTAVQASAYAEGIAYLQRALQQIDSLPDDSERARQKFSVQTHLALALRASKGLGHPEVGTAYERARELGDRLGEQERLFPVLWGLSNVHLIRAQYQVAIQMGEHLLHLTEGEEDPALRVAACRSVGAPLFWSGHFEEALGHFERAQGLYRPEYHKQLVAVAGQDEGVACFAYAAPVLALLGYADRALESSRSAIGHAERLSHPHSLAYALFFSALHFHFQGDAQSTKALTETLVRLARGKGFPLWEAAGGLLAGWTLGKESRWEEGLALMQQALKEWRAIGSEVGVTWVLGLHAEAYLELDRAKEGRAALADTFERVERTGERMFEAELHRLQGEFLRRQATPRVEEAEACLRRGIKVAREQKVKLWELRASVSLARLMQEQGRTRDARDVLSEIYGWFTEGFDAPDLREARALLEHLA